jgi:hypothetical protein
MMAWKVFKNIGRVADLFGELLNWKHRIQLLKEMLDSSIANGTPSTITLSTHQATILRTIVEKILAVLDKL